jgi:diguanylate cyclase (GGDEF)-like protein
MSNLTNFLKETSLRPVRLAVLGTLGCLAYSLGVSYLLARFAGLSGFELAALVSVLLSITIAGPLLLVLGSKLRDLSSLRQRYAQAVSHDSLTSVLTGPTFSALVGAFGTAASEPRRGALVVIDADQFKLINERFGHSAGDQALRLLSDVIRQCVRSGDLIGRLGGQRFGVFLPGATRQNAEDVAERIRVAVSEAYFAPSGPRHQLTVSLGAVLYEGEAEFDELVGAADQELMGAKSEGRNRIRYRHLHNGDSSGPPPAFSARH